MKRRRYRSSVLPPEGPIGELAEPLLGNKRRVQKKVMAAMLAIEEDRRRLAQEREAL